MNKTNKIIVIVVLVIVVLFGVGQFFANPSAINPAGSNPTPSTPGAGTTPTTQVIAYAAVPPANSTRVENGSCWTSSIAAPFRTDAWRCAVGNGISDPCFEIANSTSSLLCDINPTVINSSSTFVLHLTKPLPAPEIPPGVRPSNWAWLVQLADGTLCTPFTGTLPITATGNAANYGCAPGPLGNNVMIFGDLNASNRTWTAEIGTLSETTSSLPTLANSSTVPVGTVWQ